MADDTFEQRIKELTTRIEQVQPEDREALLALVEETRRRHDEMRRGVARARQALDDWRLHMKYRLFDNEASLREQGSNHRAKTDPPGDG